MDWLEFHNYWMDHTIENGMSVMAINKADARLAGVMTVRNMDYMHPEFDKKFSDSSLEFLVVSFQTFNKS